MNGLALRSRLALCAVLFFGEPDHRGSRWEASPRGLIFGRLGFREAWFSRGLILERLGLSPLLDLQLRLGEGTGAVLAMSIIEAALRTHSEMATFAEAGVSTRERQ